MVSLLGFQEYAWALFFEKDFLKTKVLVTPKYQFPKLIRRNESFDVILPEPIFNTNMDGEETLHFAGYIFPSDDLGKRQLASVFRAAVFHLGAHVATSHFEDYDEWRRNKDSRLAKFAISLVEDVIANAYISAWYPDKLVDLALANTLAFTKMRPAKKIQNPATRLMAELLAKVHIGALEPQLETEKDILASLSEALKQFKENVLLSFTDESIKLKDEKLKLADRIYNAVEESGPVTESPSLPHTEELGKTSLFPQRKIVNFDVSSDHNFKNCLEFLGGSISTIEDADQTWKKVAENEAIQVYESLKRQKEKEEKTLSRYQNLTMLTRFKSVEFPERDYTEFLRIKSRCKSEAHRLIESLLVARDAIDEDPRKMYGVLDLQDVIQVIASKNPRMDVFMLDENISKSYSWIILLDASRSMEIVKDFALEIFLILAETANELLLDAASWAMYAFNDRFFVIKDLKERYNVNVKSRMGGIDFAGLSYLPDALNIAGQIIKTRTENLRLITLISDGWPYGYPNINIALTETLNTLQNGKIDVVGIGVQTRKMEFLFNNNCSVYTHRDLTKKFASIYMELSRIAIES